MVGAPTVLHNAAAVTTLATRKNCKGHRHSRYSVFSDPFAHDVVVALLFSYVCDYSSS